MLTIKNATVIKQGIENIILADIFFNITLELVKVII